MEETKIDNVLISRSALKKTITEPLDINDACKNDWYEGYYTAKNEDVMAIDNAQPVEPLRVYEFKGCDNCELERLRGEWLIEPYSLIMKCSLCGSEENAKEVGSVNKDKYYCWNCGADMRGSINER